MYCVAAGVQHRLVTVKRAALSLRKLAQAAGFGAQGCDISKERNSVVVVCSFNYRVDIKRTLPSKSGHGRKTTPAKPRSAHFFRHTAENSGNTLTTLIIFKLQYHTSTQNNTQETNNCSNTQQYFLKQTGSPRASLGDSWRQGPPAVAGQTAPFSSIGSYLTHWTPTLNDLRECLRLTQSTVESEFSYGT